VSCLLVSCMCSAVLAYHLHVHAYLPRAPTFSLAPLMLA
jgi:hypothetical protein